MKRRPAWLAILTLSANVAFADCSDDWMQCRKDARDERKECVSSCSASDRECRAACDRTLNDEYKACEEAKSECRRPEARRSEPLLSSPRPSTPMVARVCSTPYGMCPMQVPIPAGSSCFCATGAGPIAGVGR